MRMQMRYQRRVTKGSSDKRIPSGLNSFAPPVNWSWGFQWDQFLGDLDLRKFPTAHPTVFTDRTSYPAWTPVEDGDNIILLSEWAAKR